MCKFFIKKIFSEQSKLLFISFSQVVQRLQKRILTQAPDCYYTISEKYVKKLNQSFPGTYVQVVQAYTSNVKMRKNKNNTNSTFLSLKLLIRNFKQNKRLISKILNNNV